MIEEREKGAMSFSGHERNEWWLQLTPLPSNSSFTTQQKSLLSMITKKK